MKQVVAIIKPFLAEKVILALEDEAIEEMVVREVKGFGRQKNYLEQYGDNEYSLAFVPKVELTFWASDGAVDRIVDKIVEVSRTGRLGDGKIFVLPSVMTGDL